MQCPRPVPRTPPCTPHAAAIVQVAAALLFGVDNAGVLSVSMDTGVVVNTTGCASLRITLPPTQLREVQCPLPAACCAGGAPYWKFRRHSGRQR